MKKRDNIIELVRIEQSDEGTIRYFEWNNREYSILNSQVFKDDGFVLLRAILQQAVNDYVKLSCKDELKQEEELDFYTANQFIHNDDYFIEYGGMDLNLRDILSLLTGSDPNMRMFREGIERQLDDYKEDEATDGVEEND